MITNKNKVRVRFAPSPTGFVHIGSLRTALYNYLFAKKNKGDFILRIEDTDQKRFVKGALENLLAVIDKLNLDHNEGIFKQDISDKIINSRIDTNQNYPDIAEVGEYGPYIQSERLPLYKKYAEQLVQEGKAYYCFCKPERLSQVRKKQIDQKLPPIYDRHCLNNLTSAEIKEKIRTNIPRVIRLKIPSNEIIEFSDQVKGKIKFNTNLIDDQIILKSDGYPTYHLANVVDDHLMKITNVIRGEEWLSSTPKHIILYNYFNWEIPRFAHLPLLLNADKSKLSKRQGDVAVEDYLQKGYLKEALINFVALLGWNPGAGETQEIFTLTELIEKFSLTHIHKGGAVFDVKKLDWINAQWIKKISLDELYKRSLKFWKQKEFYQQAEENKKSEEYIKKVLAVEKERLQKLSEVGEENKFFFAHNISTSLETIRWKNSTSLETKKYLKKSLKTLEDIAESDWNLKNIEKQLLITAGNKRGDLLFPLRAVLTGQKKSPSPFEVAWVLGKKESLKRIKATLNII
jgi:glutamyl-tRNA synthetase